MTPHEIAARLGPEEEVLWWGRPLPKRSAEVWEGATIVFSAMVAALSVLVGFIMLIAGGFRSAVPAVVALLFGAWVMLSAYAASATRAGRADHTLYAITSRRVLFLDWRWPRGRLVREVPLTQTLYPTIRAEGSGCGTISFKARLPRRRWGDVRSFDPWAFADIEHPSAVYDIYMRASAEAQRTAWRAVARPPTSAAG